MFRYGGGFGGERKKTGKNQRGRGGGVAAPLGPSGTPSASSGGEKKGETRALPRKKLHEI